MSEALKKKRGRKKGFRFAPGQSPSSEKHDQIVAMRKTGKTVYEIAAHFGITHQAVSLVLVARSASGDIVRNAECFVQAEAKRTHKQEQVAQRTAEKALRDAELKSKIVEMLSVGTSRRVICQKLGIGSQDMLHRFPELRKNRFSPRLRLNSSAEAAALAKGVA